MNILFATLLDAAPAAGNPQGDMMPTIVMMVALFAIVYFFMIRPQNKKQKEAQKFRNSLQPGQDVMTIGGVHGTIRSVDDSAGTVVLEIATGTKVKFEKSAIVPLGTAQQK